MTMTAEPTTEVTAIFEIAKETPGTYKFTEVTPKGTPPVSGSLYLKKYVVDALDATVVEVTIRRVR